MRKGSIVGNDFEHRTHRILLLVNERARRVRRGCGQGRKTQQDEGCGKWLPRAHIGRNPPSRPELYLLPGQATNRCRFLSICSTTPCRTIDPGCRRFHLRSPHTAASRPRRPLNKSVPPAVPSRPPLLWQPSRHTYVGRHCRNRRFRCEWLVTSTLPPQ